MAFGKESHGISQRFSHSIQHPIALCVGDKIPLPCSCRRSETSSSGAYPTNMSATRFADRTRAREQRSCSQLGFSPDASVCESDSKTRARAEHESKRRLLGQRYGRVLFQPPQGKTHRRHNLSKCRFAQAGLVWVAIMLAIENTRQTHGKLLSKPNVSSWMNSLATLNSLSLFSGQGHQHHQLLRRAPACAGHRL